MKIRLLILDDDEAIQLGIKNYFNQKDYQVFSALKPAQAFSILKKEKIDILLLDINLPEIDGIEVLKKIKTQHDPNIEVIMITHKDHSDKIINAMQIGAYDYFYKPLKLAELQGAIERSHCFNTIQNKLESQVNQNSLINNDLIQKVGGKILGESNVIKAVLKYTIKAAKSQDTPVLITGESGSGKELIARTIHYLSERKDNHFYPINCAAVPSTLIESEFFGHTKGAFTGAIENKKGCFEAANQGTLFIDEIGDMPYSAQSKLLRVLEAKKMKKIGSNQETEINVRVISASNKNIKKMVHEKKFRLDLYYRLNTLEIKVPALRERKEDIPPLLEHYIHYYAHKINKKILEIDHEIYTILSGYHFPGNIRELKNMAERAVILCDGKKVKVNHLPINEIMPNSSPLQAENRRLNLKENEKINIQKALQITKNNVSQAAKLLGISRFALYRKMKKNNL